MPPTAQEQTVLTLFADVHYCLTAAGQRPRHSRFEKSSYVYLYTTPSLAARIEIANNPGTPHQDAFSGALTYTSVSHAQRQPSLVTMDVMRRADGDSMWQLRSHDGRMDLVHSLDIYFFTNQDADKFVQACSRLAIGDLQVDGQSRQSSAMAGEHRDNMSPVVQKLEQAAISNPQPKHAYGQRDSVSTTSSSAGHSQTPGFPPPPPGGPQAQQQQPLAYNPAAPAAPEPIAHREKTPPPVDAGLGTGLNAAAYHDQAPPQAQAGYQYGAKQPPQQQQYGGYSGQAPQHGYNPSQSGTPSFSPPAAQRTNSFPPPPPSQHQTPPHHSSAYPSPPSSQPPPNQQYSQPHSHSHTSSFAGPPQQPRANSLAFQQYASPPTSPGHPPAQVPAAYQPSLGSPAPNSGNPTHPSNPGYNTYGTSASPHQHQPYSSPPPQQYGAGPQSPGFPPQQQQQQQQGVPSAQLIHQSVYVPSEADMAGKPAPNAGSGGQNPGKFEQRAGQLEKGVNRFLKRLDKHL